VRIANWPFPLEQFELPVNHLHAAPWGAAGANAADFQTLYGFFLARTGPWDRFLFIDPADHNTITNATYAGLTPTYGQNVIGTGDGATLAFQFMRTIGAGTQPIFDISGPTVDGTSAGLAPLVASPYVNVYVNGSAVTSGWTMSAAGMLTFVSAPANGYSIAVDCTYFRRVCFADDNIDMENFMQNLWRCKAIKLRCVYA
jgi:uncharacterized protein (TIGR02217 family)